MQNVMFLIPVSRNGLGDCLLDEPQDHYFEVREIYYFPVLCTALNGSVLATSDLRKPVMLVRLLRVLYIHLKFNILRSVKVHIFLTPYICYLFTEVP
jgi:hypothetical protein